MHIQSIRVIPNIIEQTAPDFFLREQQSRGYKIGDAVDYEQGYSREYKIGEKHIRKRQLIEIGQHCVHSYKPAARVNEHSDSSADGADADKERPEY